MGGSGVRVARKQRRLPAWQSEEMVLEGAALRRRQPGLPGEVEGVLEGFRVR